MKVKAKIMFTEAELLKGLDAKTAHSEDLALPLPAEVLV